MKIDKKSKINSSVEDDFELPELDENEWAKIDHKQVRDSDGFLTDYCLYTNGKKFICMFGDEDVEEPNPDYADFETDSETEALDWFADYRGFEDDEEDDIMSAKNENQPIWKKYFKRVSTKTICEMSGYEPDELARADQLEAYDAKHVAWLVPKDEYADWLSDFGMCELVNEGGDIFIGQCSHDRLFDITDEIQEAIDYHENGEDDEEDDLVIY